MRAVAIREFGSAEGMELVELPEPIPASGQVVISTEAIGVGGVDAVIRRGSIAGYGFSKGLVPGSEVAGTVIGLGENVDPRLLGRRVWAFTGTSGGYVERAVATTENILPLPSELSSVAAVTLGSAGPVAHFALEHAHLTRGESILVRGAAGSIGIAAIQLAVKAGAGRIAVTTSNAERGRRLQSMGATDVLDRTGDGPSAEASFDVVFDLVGGPLTPTFIDRLAPNGRLTLVGAVGGFPAADFGGALLAGFQRSLSVGTFSLDTVDRTELARVRADLFHAAIRGDLHPVVHDVMPLERAIEAHRQMDAGEVFGRIVLTP